MDAQLEQWINGPAGRYAGLDTFMQDAANWGQWIFGGIVVAWLIYGWVRGERRDRWGALAALVAARGLRWGSTRSSDGSGIAPGRLSPTRALCTS